MRVRVRPLSHTLSLTHTLHTHTWTHAQDVQHLRYVDAWDLFSHTKKTRKKQERSSTPCPCFRQALAVCVYTCAQIHARTHTHTHTHTHTSICNMHVETNTGDGSERKIAQRLETKIPQSLMPDMLHPNDRGMRLWGEYESEGRARALGGGG